MVRGTKVKIIDEKLPMVGREYYFCSFLSSDIVGLNPSKHHYNPSVFVKTHQVEEIPEKKGKDKKKKYKRTNLGDMLSRLWN